MEPDIAGDSIPSSEGVAGDCHERQRRGGPERGKRFLVWLIASSAGFWAGQFDADIGSVTEAEVEQAVPDMKVCALLLVSASLHSHRFPFSQEKGSGILELARKAVRGQTHGFVVYRVEQAHSISPGLDVCGIDSRIGFWQAHRDSEYEGEKLRDVAGRWCGQMGKCRKFCAMRKDVHGLGPAHAELFLGAWAMLDLPAATHQGAKPTKEQMLSYRDSLGCEACMKGARELTKMCD